MSRREAISELFDSVNGETDHNTHVDECASPKENLRVN